MALEQAGVTFLASIGALALLLATLGLMLRGILGNDHRSTLERELHHALERNEVLRRENERRQR